MASEVRGVVALAKGEPVSLVTIVVPDPGPGEAVVRVQACGVCHTDLHYREGGINDDFPFLLGHEAAGVVEAVGPDVTSVGPGDFVVLNWRAVCGECRSCRRGRPWYCFSTHNASQKMTPEPTGRPSPPPWASVPSPRRPWWRPASAPRSTRPPGPRRSVCWDVGSWPGWAPPCSPARWAWATRWRCSAAAASAARPSPGPAWPGRRPSSPSTSTRESSTWPGSSGPPTWSTPPTEDVVEAVRALTGGFGADVCIEAVGNPAVMEQAFYARDLAGTLVQVGVPTPDMRIDLPMIEFFGRGGRLKPSWYGDCLPSRDFPMLVDLYLAGAP